MSNKFSELVFLIFTCLYITEPFGTISSYFPSYIVLYAFLYNKTLEEFTKSILYVHLHVGDMKD